MRRFVAVQGGGARRDRCRGLEVQAAADQPQRRRQRERPLTDLGRQGGRELQGRHLRRRYAALRTHAFKDKGKAHGKSEDAPGPAEDKVRGKGGDAPRATPHGQLTPADPHRD